MPKYASVAATITTGTNVSSAIDISEHTHIVIDCPTFTCEAANSSLRLDGCDTSTGTFRPVYHAGVASAASGIVVWETLQGTGSMMVAYDDPSKPKFIKARSSSTATAAISVRVLMYSD